MQEALSCPGEVPPRQDDCDLRTRSHQVDHVPFDRPRDVAVPALDEIQRDRDAEVHPVSDQLVLHLRIDGRVHRGDLVGAQGERVTNRLQRSAIGPVDEHDGEMPRSWQHPDRTWAAVLVWMVSYEG